MKSLNNRTYIKNLSEHQGQTVTIMGWVKILRDQGKMTFIDIKDETGSIQGIVLPNRDVSKIVKTLRTEWVIEVQGIVNERPKNNVNSTSFNGNIELEIIDINVLNKSETPPFPIDSNTKEVDENLRMKYRYLDLRNSRMQKNIRNRANIQKFIREYLFAENFVEIETPLITAPTPEGSRSFVIPSRTYKGKFYSLPQSPQQYKQLLMISGFEKYFQFARCMRDEDSRGDRQLEFTQLDLEMSFVDEETVMNINEKLLIEIVSKNYPEKTIQEIPFPRMKYKDAMEKYGTDRPDIRKNPHDSNLLAFLWITDFPMFEKTNEDNVDDTGEWTFTHNPFSKPKGKSMEDFLNKKNIENILTSQYDITLNGYEIGGGSIRNHESNALKTTFEIMGYSEERIIENFGHMLTALDFGAPPHGGIAWGFDRLMMILENEPNIREIIPFPKTGEGRDLLFDSPRDISDKQRKELGI